MNVKIRTSTLAFLVAAAKILLDLVVIIVVVAVLEPVRRLPLSVYSLHGPLPALDCKDR